MRTDTMTRGDWVRLVYPFLVLALILILFSILASMAAVDVAPYHGRWV